MPALCLVHANSASIPLWNLVRYQGVDYITVHHLMKHGIKDIQDQIDWIRADRPDIVGTCETRGSDFVRCLQREFPLMLVLDWREYWMQIDPDGLLEKQSRRFQSYPPFGIPSTEK